MEDYIYPEKIRKFEKDIIEFVVQSGKNKRNSEIESHILAYFLLHPNLTQKEIQKFSTIFREKKISIGSISNFLKKYEEYRVITKIENLEKKGTFTYSLKDRNIKTLMATGFEVGFEKIQDWIEYTQERLHTLDEIKIVPNEINFQSILKERLEELTKFFNFHYNLMKSFFSGNFSDDDNPEIKNTKEKIEKIKKQNFKDIEDSIIHFIQINPLFAIDEPIYLPIFCYLLTRRSLTQLELQNLTKLSSGTVSEGLNYFIKNNLIELDKVKGTRMRYYTIPSIGYSNYMKQYQRFNQIKEIKKKIVLIYQEMNGRESELKDLNGYEIIRNFVKEILELMDFVDKGIIIFEHALKHYKNQK